MSKTYTPQQDSVAWKVIEFLTTNPGEELTKEDVAAKYDKPANNVHSLLGPAVDAGVLKRRQNDDGEVVYTLGNGCAAVKPSKARNPTLRPDVLVAGGELGSNAKRPPPPEIDLAAVVLRDGVPMPESRTGLSKWPELLDRMGVGQSCVLPIAHKKSVGGAMTKAKRAGRLFAVRILSEAEFGLWRVK